MNGTDTNIPNSSSTGSEPNNNDGLVIKNGILEQCVTRNRSVAVPSGVHTIGKGAFKGCTSLEQILLPDTSKVLLCHLLTYLFHLSLNLLYTSGAFRPALYQDGPSVLFQVSQ